MIGGGRVARRRRVRSPSEPSELLALSLRPHCKAGRLAAFAEASAPLRSLNLARHSLGDVGEIGPYRAAWKTTKLVECPDELGE